MKRQWASLIVLVWAAGLARAEATLKVGDPAPKLTVSSWVKGEPVKRFEPGKMYVVEFWATWCGPCIAAMPELSALSEKHPDVVFMGVNVLERQAGKVAPFMEGTGKKMRYRVAIDDTSARPRGAMAETWLDAAEANGIPATFLVGKDSRIAWIGHPNDLGEVLEKVKAGTFDAQAAAREAMETKTLEEKLEIAADAERIDEAMKLLETLSARAKPSAKEGYRTYRFFLLGNSGRMDEARKVAESALAESRDAQSLWQIADHLTWRFPKKQALTPEDLVLATRLGERVMELEPKGPLAYAVRLADTYARRGMWEQAVATLKAARDRSDLDEETGAWLPEVKENLGWYEQKSLPAEVRLLDLEREKNWPEMRKLYQQKLDASGGRMAYTAFLLIKLDREHGDAAEARKRAIELVRDLEHPSLLNTIAWFFGTVEGGTPADVAVGLDAARKCDVVSKPKRGAYLDTLARLEAMSGNWDDAVALQERAVGLASPGEVDELREALAGYRLKKVEPRK